MSRTIKEWDEIIEAMPTEKKEEVLAAINTLKDWPEFKESYGWTGIFTLGISFEYAIRADKKEAA